MAVQPQIQHTHPTGAGAPLLPGLPWLSAKAAECMAQRRIAEFLCSHRRTIQPLVSLCNFQPACSSPFPQCAHSLLAASSSPASQEGGHWAAGPFHPQQASRSFASGAQAPGRVSCLTSSAGNSPIDAGIFHIDLSWTPLSCLFQTSRTSHHC